MEIVEAPPLFWVHGVAYSFAFTGRSGSGSYSFAASSLPSGWTFVSGVLANSSPAVASFTVQITMTDTANRSNSPVIATYPITIG